MNVIIPLNRYNPKKRFLILPKDEVLKQPECRVLCDGYLYRFMLSTLQEVQNFSLKSPLVGTNYVFLSKRWLYENSFHREPYNGQ